MFGVDNLRELDGGEFVRLIERFLWHCGFDSVAKVDGAGDLGADIVAEREGERWVIQCKSKVRVAVSESAVKEAQAAMLPYGASKAAVVTNSTFTKGARDFQQRLLNVSGIDVKLWDGDYITALWEDDRCVSRLGSPSLRPYQSEAFAALSHDLQKSRRALLILATGLGKTVVAGTVMESVLQKNPKANVLVVAHARELIDQLERAFWRHLDKATPTQQVTGDDKPYSTKGVTFATIQSVLPYVRRGYKPDLIIVDEAHHVGADGQYADLITETPESMKLGVTATPWRGDLTNIEDSFGEASYKVGIEEGMRLGYLCDVKYRIFLDDINWDVVKELSKNSYSIKHLNSQLFLPQRDEKIRDELLSAWQRTVNPRGIIFCQSIEHAERMLNIIQAVGDWSAAKILHSGLLKRERQMTLMDFRTGRVPLLVAVDVLNEGVDVPDVNIVCFARVTHSRRIFVQQLGRGLRLSQGKEFVTVLDFVSDLRRVAATMNLRQLVAHEAETLYIPSSHSITFEDKKAENLMTEWLKDAANLDTASDEVKLSFPDYSD